MECTLSVLSCRPTNTNLDAFIRISQRSGVGTDSLYFSSTNLAKIALIMANSNIAANAAIMANILPVASSGVYSPYPTVVIVVITNLTSTPTWCLSVQSELYKPDRSLKVIDPWHKLPLRNVETIYCYTKGYPRWNEHHEEWALPKLYTQNWEAFHQLPAILDGHLILEEI